MSEMDRLIRHGPDPEYERREAIYRAARDAGFLDPTDAWAFLSNRQGEPAELVDRLARERPYFLSPAGVMGRVIRRQPLTPPEPEPEPQPQLPTGSADAGVLGEPTGGPPDMNKIIRRAYRGDY